MLKCFLFLGLDGARDYQAILSLTENHLEELHIKIEENHTPLFNTSESLGEGPFI